MRPRLDAGEYRGRTSGQITAVVASMRPRLDAGEYPRSRRDLAERSTCFNEAPAGCRGIPTGGLAPYAPCASFNEAPAGCRGIPRTLVAWAPSTLMLQ